MLPYKAWGLRIKCVKSMGIINHMQWPSQRPNLNPTEHLWEILREPALSTTAINNIELGIRDVFTVNNKSTQK